MKVEERYACHPEDFKSYETDRIRHDFLVEKIFIEDDISLVYSQIDRFIVGGAFPVSKSLILEPFDALKASYFLFGRELGIINVGGNGTIKTDTGSYSLGYKDALYLGRGTKHVEFISENKSEPAKFYFNSAIAHKEYPSKKVTLQDAEKVILGSLETSNERQINKLIVNSVVETCQLQMGMTELKTGNIWNTMPAHTHSRRMEAYFYFEVKPEQAVCHFMGQPQETRHIWMHNEQAVISPTWSLHSAAGTSNYVFIWGMAGENLDYSDMDTIQITDLK